MIKCGICLTTIDEQKSLCNICVDKRRHYHKEGTEFKKIAAYYQSNIIKWLKEYKIFYGCAICGYNRCAYVLHFHHVNPKLKIASISSMRQYVQRFQLYHEMKKCIILCANCHGEVENGFIPVLPQISYHDFEPIVEARMAQKSESNGP